MMIACPLAPLFKCPFGSCTAICGIAISDHWSPVKLFIIVPNRFNWVPMERKGWVPFTQAEGKVYAKCYASGNPASAIERAQESGEGGDSNHAIRTNEMS